MRRTLCSAFALALALLASTRAFAVQTDAWSVKVPSPTAASLGKFGDIPVSLFTGVPEITIPLFTAQGKTLQLPISLRYHASGIRVEEIGGWVGMGWALEAGGSITRTVRGMVDEWLKGYYNTGATFYDPMNWPNPTPELLYNMANSQVDGEPDEFFFNFAGVSGQFVLGPTSTNPSLREIRTIPYRNWLIVPTIIGDSIVTWQITTDDGTRYTFGVHETQVDRSPQSVAPFYAHPYASSWHLTEIRAAGGDVITLQYVAYNAEHDMGHSQSRRDESYFSCMPGDNRTRITKYSITAQRLVSITAAQHTVTFDTTFRTDALSSGAYQIPVGTKQEPRLDKVTAATSAGRVLRQFQLVHDYSIGNRLTLRQVFEKDRDGVSLPPYTLSYAGPPLPDRMSYAVDHWGYYNAKTGNTTLIPPGQGPSGLQYTGATRMPDGTYTKAGMLTRITYPTGGYNDFIYEPNDYSTVASGSHPIFDSGPTNSIQAISSASTPGLRTAALNITGVAPSWVTITVFFSSFPSPCTNCPYATGPGIGSPIQSMTWVGTLAPGNYQIQANEAGYGITVSIGATWRNYIIVDKKIGGGVRVAEIDAADAMGNITVRKYKYNLLGIPPWSSGVVQHEPKYDFSMQGWVQNGGDVFWCAFWERSSMSKLPLGSGPPVAYSEVTVWDGPNGEYGKTRHTFTSESDPVLTLGWPYLRRTSFAWKRGAETGVQMRDASDRLQRAGTSTYAFPTPAQTTRTFKGMSFSYWVTTPGPLIYVWNEFHVASAWMQRDGQISTAYDTTGATSFSTTTSYTYGNPTHVQLTQITETNSDGTQRITRMKYPDDYLAGSGNAEAAAITAMQSTGTAHMPAAVIERSVSSRVGALERILHAEITTFKEFLAGQFLPYQRFVLNSPSPIP